MINLLFCGNRKMMDGIITCLLSIFKRCTGQSPFRIYIYTMDAKSLDENFVPLTEEDAQFLSKMAKGYNKANEIIRIDVSDIYKQEFGGSPNEDAYCSPYTLLRLLADLVPGMPDKLLYLDTDILFNRDVRLLYRIDVTDYEYAAARDHYGKLLVKRSFINAGVLLLNMKMIRQTNLFAKCRELLYRKKLAFADESAIIKCTTKSLIISQRYNDQKFLYPNTVARHFSKRLFYLPYPHTANIKPWMTDEVVRIFNYHEFDDIFEEYHAIISDYRGTNTR